VPGPEVRTLGEIAKRNHLELVIGVIERAQGTLYCPVLFFSAEGELRAKHRKLMPTASERLSGGLETGQQSRR
jgi:nitrilase